MHKLLEENRNSWNKNSKFYYGTTALPVYGCYLKTEDHLNLFEEIKNKKILEIGSGSGHSLKYLASKEASDLWGLDISEEQTKASKELLKDIKIPITLKTCSMEERLDNVNEYFDIVFSIYALGWTLDLDKTLNNVARYLKTGGIFIFSWDHPFNLCTV